MYKFDDDEFLTIQEAAQYLNVTENTVHEFVGYCYIYCKHWAYVWTAIRVAAGVPEGDPKYLKGIGKLGQLDSFGMLATRDQRWHDKHSDEPGRPCVPRRRELEVTSTPYMKCDGRHLTKPTTFIIIDYLSTIVESGLFSIKDLDQLAIQYGFEQQHISSNTGESRDADDTPEGRPLLHTEAKFPPLEQFRSMENLRFSEITIKVDPENNALRVEARGKQTIVPFSALGLTNINQITLNAQGKLFFKIADDGTPGKKDGRALQRLSQALRAAFGTDDPPISNGKCLFTVFVPKDRAAEAKARWRPRQYDDSLSQKGDRTSNEFFSKDDPDYDPHDPMYSGLDIDDYN